MHYFMHLYILYNDNRFEHQIISRFSDLSTTKSRFYYYEKPGDDYGKGTTFKREDIQCFEILLYPSQEYEKEIEKQCTTVKEIN